MTGTSRAGGCNFYSHRWSGFPLAREWR